MDGAAQTPNEIAAVLRHMGLIAEDEQPVLTPLTGGVASDIWKVEARNKIFAVKRALPKLRVAADWRVPVTRNASEADWLRTARDITPDAAPEIIAEDRAWGLFAMTYLPSDRFPVWKAELHAGRVDLDFAAAVGRTIAKIHSATASDTAIAERFDNDAIFHAIRLEPYLEATAAKHPAIAEQLFALSKATLSRHVALVHGDLSPKNILVGANGPIFIDAECAWYGDPAFDLAFCLNHLLLKCLWTPASTPQFLGAFDAMQNAYLSTITHEPAAALEQRAAALLPGLFLARVDGKSPAEYITSDEGRAKVRAAAIPLIRHPPARLQIICDAWAATLQS
jgi:5-methylthioribose kinase